MKKRRVAICLIIGCVLLLLTLDICYGHIRKEVIVADALGFDLPSDSQFLQYRYFPGYLQAVIVSDKVNSYDYIRDHIYRQDVSFTTSEIDIELANALKLKPLEGKQVLEAMEFFAEMPPMYVAGLICRLEGETILYVTRPLPDHFEVAKSLL